MDYKEFAYEMYKREHDRWKDWAIFFFGSILSVFVAWKEIKDVIPLWVPSLISFLLSLQWIIVSLSIRASTDAWEETIKELEKNGDNKFSFDTFRAKLKNKNQWTDLIEIINIFNKKWWKETIFSVTRTLVWIGIILSGFFATLFIISLIDC